MGVGQPDQKLITIDEFVERVTEFISSDCGVEIETFDPSIRLCSQLGVDSLGMFLLWESVCEMFHFQSELSCLSADPSIRDVYLKALECSALPRVG